MTRDSPVPDNREAPRVAPFVVPCELHAAGRTVAAFMVNLSQGGAQLVTTESPLPRAGDEGIVAARFREHPGATRLPVRIVWIQKGAGPGRETVFGLRFRDLSDRERAAVDRALERFHAHVSLLEAAPAEPAADNRRSAWDYGPDDAESGWLALSDDELLHRIESLSETHQDDAHLIAVIRSQRHFFVRQEAAKRLRNREALLGHADDRHIGQILVRSLNRREDLDYLEQLVEETRYLEVRKAARAQLERLRKEYD